MRKHRTAAQKAATRNLVAMNRARKANPAKRHHKRHARKNPIAVKHTYRRAAKRRTNPMQHYRRHRKHRRHNPISVNGIVELLKNGAMGAVGALGVDLVMGNLPIPATLSSRNNADGSINYLYHLTKAGLAVGVSIAGKKFLGSKGEMLGLGAMTVNLYDFFRRVMPASIPLGYANPGKPVSANLSMYTGGNRGLPRAQSKTPALAGGNANAIPYPGTGQRFGMYVR